jgi:c-di-GMP-binding flagellar brake protein YcgR
MTITEQRQFERVYFSREAGLRVVLTPPELPDPWFTATLMDLSEGGCCLIKEKDQEIPLRSGTRLQVREWIGSETLDGMAGARITVRWQLELEGAKHVMFGTEFDGIAPDQKTLVRNFLADQRAPEVE